MAVDAVYFGMALPIRVSDVMSRPARTVSPTATVELGQQLTAVCEVVESMDRNKFELTSDVVNAAGNTILEGQTAVLADPSPETASVTFTPLDAE